jgi:isopenicillin N synthase-like dioxygenase
VPESDEIVINVGDMLQRHVNNYFKSTTHRVINPPKSEWHKPRLSIPFFLHPRSEMDLSCLPGTITESNPLHYPPITAGEYLAERLREIGLKNKGYVNCLSLHLNKPIFVRKSTFKS